MNTNLTVIIAARNDQETIEKTLKSTKWASEIIVVLANDSSDNTENISKNFTTNFFRCENHLGKQRLLGIAKSSNDWILILDTDEVVSPGLAEEINSLIKSKKYSGYYIPYKNFFLHHELVSKAQQYEKMRLFNKRFGTVENLNVHPEIIIKGKVGRTKNYIYHDSFRSIPQILRKFTYYAQQEAPGRFAKRERATLKKFTLYPAHMFWSLFIEGEGYKDSIWGLGLAFCFTYYEFMRYFMLLKYQRSLKK